ncbi:MAG: hypothetical protein ACYC0V_21630, partial [Armatimonadota bacterium]
MMLPDTCCNLHHGLLYEKLPDKAAHCNVCLRRCIIKEGSAGFCNTRVNKDGEIYSTIYGAISSMGVDPIEKKPVYHYLPG